MSAEKINPSVPGSGENMMCPPSASDEASSGRHNGCSETRYVAPPMEQQLKCEINGYELLLTCGACPEQYDVLRDGEQVGYLRLRHGYFRADYPDCGGETVYEAEPDGEGEFLDEERSHYLTEAVNALDARLRRSSLSEEGSEFYSYSNRFEQDGAVAAHPSVSDGRREAGETEGLDPKDDSAVGAAETPVPLSSQTTREIDPTAYLHEISEPGLSDWRLYSSSPENPWSHWTEEHRAQCHYRVTPLYSSHSLKEPERERDEALAKVANIQWWEGIYEDKPLTKEQIANELADYRFLLDQVPKVYDNVTGGLLSKTSYTAETVTAAFNDYLQRERDEAYEEGEQAALSQVEALQAENEKQRDALAYWEAHGADPRAEALRSALEWRPMEDAPLETPIMVKMEADRVAGGIWVATAVLHEDADHWTDGATILHYNGASLVNGFRGPLTGWMPLDRSALSQKEEQ